MTQMEESFQRLLRGLYLAVIFMFLLLVAQFRSLVEPFNMVFSLSLMLTGILGGLLPRAARPSRPSRSWPWSSSPA